MRKRKRKRKCWEWERPETVSWGGGYVSDTPCWTRGYTSSPPPLLLYTCAFIDTLCGRKTQLVESTPVSCFHEPWDAYLAQRLQTSQAWSGTQNVPGLHWHLVSEVVVQDAVSISSGGRRQTWETSENFGKTHGLVDDAPITNVLWVVVWFEAVPIWSNIK